MTNLPINDPGIYADVAEDDYHEDCVGPAPSLSASIAKVLVKRSPMHAAFAHPRLNPNFESDDGSSRAGDIGTAAHRVLLGRGVDIDVLEFDDYRKKDAQVARDEARAAGRLPILADEMAAVLRMVEATRDQLVGTECEGCFEDGTPEAVLVWREHNGVWCRSRLDFLPHKARAGGHVVLADYKTTAASAHPDDWKRIAFDKDYDVQSVFYPRGIKALIPEVRSVAFKFVVQEQEAPFGLSVVDFGGQAETEAADLVEAAINLWGLCTARNSWPGYPKETTSYDPPAYRSQASEARRLNLLARIARWQSPTAQAAE